MFSFFLRSTTVVPTYEDRHDALSVRYIIGAGPSSAAAVVVIITLFAPKPPPGFPQNHPSIHPSVVVELLLVGWLLASHIDWGLLLVSEV